MSKPDTMIEVPFEFFRDIGHINEIRLYVTLVMARKLGHTPGMGEVAKIFGKDSDGYTSFGWRQLYNKGWIEFDDDRLPVPLTECAGFAIRVPYSAWHVRKFGVSND